MFATALKHLISRPYISSFHIRNYILELRNWFSFASLRRIENKCISILVLVEIILTLWKVNKSTIINIKRTRSFKWLDCLMDNIFVQFGEWVFQHTICIPVGTIGVQLLAISFLDAYEVILTKFCIMQLFANVSRSNVELYNHILLSRGYTVLIHIIQIY